MDSTMHHELSRSSTRSWAILFGMAVAFLGWGFLLFTVIGDKGAPEWDYSVVEDIPGQSPYSTMSAHDFSGFIPEFKRGEDVPPQHVLGPQKALKFPLQNPRRP